MPETLP